MSDKSQAALKAMLLDIKSWPKHQRDAAQAGWEYVLDQCCTKDGYDIKGMHGSRGEDEAMDMATATVEERPWKKRDREAAADYIHHGMLAAIKFVKEFK